MWRVKNALAAGCSKTHFHLTCVWVRIQGYKALQYNNKYKVTLNPTFSVLPLSFTTWRLLLHQRKLTSWFSLTVHNPVQDDLSFSIYPMGTSSNHSTWIKCNVLCAFPLPLRLDSLSIFFCHTHRTQRVGVFWIVIRGVKGVQK